MQSERPMINEKYISSYMKYLGEQERRQATMQKYRHDLHALVKFLDGAELTKTALISWKEKLTGEYAPASVNAMLAAVSGGRKGAYTERICPAGTGSTEKRE